MHSAVMPGLCRRTYLAGFGSRRGHLEWTVDTTITSTPASGQSKYVVLPRDYIVTISWLQRITAILQQTQRALYRIRRLKILSKEWKERNAQVISLRQKRHTQRTQTLFAALRLPYIKPSYPRRIPLSRPPPTPLTPVPPTTLPCANGAVLNSTV